MSDNTKLWDLASKTDPKYTKQFDRGGFKGTAINATYVVRKLTEMFGPCGKGWWLVIDEERVIPGPAVTTKTLRKETVSIGDAGPVTKDTETVVVEQEMLHVIRGHIEYFDSDGIQRHTGPQFGQTKLVQKFGQPEKGNVRYMFDEEAPKKSVTDCMTKCAVLLGVAADVHLGLFDDNKYVNELKAEFAEKAEHEKVQHITPEQLKMLVDTAAKAGLAVRTFNKKYGIAFASELPASKFEEALADIVEYGQRKAAKQHAQDEAQAQHEGDEQ